MDTVVLQEEALQLPEGDRALLADRLLESLSPEYETLSNQWREEAEERLSAFEKGELKSHEGVQVLDKLRRRIS